MKKVLLMSLSACISFAAIAQNSNVIFKETLRKTSYVCKEAPSSYAPVTTVKTVKPQSQNKSAVTVIDIGSSTNALTSAGGPKGNTDYNPAINTITFIHRSVLDTALVEDPTSGYYRYDVSKDGGNTWQIQQGPIYMDSTGAGNVVRGRYPQGVIINPTGNTSPDSAFLTFWGTATTSTADWIAYLTGTEQLGGPMTQSQQVIPFVSPFIGTVTSGLTVTQNNVVWNIDGAQSSTTLDPPPNYTGTQYIYKGLWNPVTKTVDYTRTDFPFATSVKADGGNFYIGSGIHFSADGQTGYITIISNNQDIALTDSANLLTIFKTTDGGATWDAGKTLMLDTVDAILNLGTNLYELGFEQDGVVDMNGNLHVIAAILPSNASAETIGIPGSGQWGMFDIFTTDGGVTYRVKLLATPETYRGEYQGASPVPIDNRGQVSATWALDKLLFTWADTDTSIFGPGDANLNPNLHCVGYNVTTGMWTSEQDLTSGTPADAEVHLFNAAPYVIGTTGTYEIPVTYTTFQNPSAPNPDNQVLHKYLKGATIDDSQFTQTDAGLPLGVFLAGINEPQSIVSGSMNIYPNPGKGVTALEFNLRKNATDVKVEITNAIGQVVYSNVLGTVAAGTQKISLNTSEFGSGIYFCTLRVNGETVSKKIAVE